MLFSSKSSGSAGAGEFMVVEGQQHEDGGVVVDVAIFDHRRVCSAVDRNLVCVCLLIRFTNLLGAN